MHGGIMAAGQEHRGCGHARVLACAMQTPFALRFDQTTEAAMCNRSPMRSRRHAPCGTLGTTDLLQMHSTVTDRRTHALGLLHRKAWRAGAWQAACAAPERDCCAAYSYFSASCRRTYCAVSAGRAAWRASRRTVDQPLYAHLRGHACCAQKHAPAHLAAQARERQQYIPLHKPPETSLVRPLSSSTIVWRGMWPRDTKSPVEVCPRLSVCPRLAAPSGQSCICRSPVNPTNATDWDE